MYLDANKDHHHKYLEKKTHPDCWIICIWLGIDPFTFRKPAFSWKRAENYLLRQLTNYFDEPSNIEESKTLHNSTTRTLTMAYNSANIALLLIMILEDRQDDIPFPGLSRRSPCKNFQSFHHGFYKNYMIPRSFTKSTIETNKRQWNSASSENAKKPGSSESSWPSFRQ